MLPPESLLPAWAPYAMSTFGLLLLAPAVRRPARWVRETLSVAREYRLGGVSRLRALWLAVTL